MCDRHELQMQLLLIALSDLDALVPDITICTFHQNAPPTTTTCPNKKCVLPFVVAYAFPKAPFMLESMYTPYTCNFYK